MTETRDHSSTTVTETKRYLTLGLGTGLLIWGFYLSIGVVLFNDDLRKGFIVFACTLLFLGLWWTVYRVSQKERESRDANRGLWDYTSTAGFLLAATSSGAMLGALQNPGMSMSGGYRTMLAVSLFTLAIGSICTIVGLSNRLRPRGKWLGLVALLLLVATLVMGFWVAPFGDLPM